MCSKKSRSRAFSFSYILYPMNKNITIVIDGHCVEFFVETSSEQQKTLQGT